MTAARYAAVAQAAFEARERLGLPDQGFGIVEAEYMCAIIDAALAWRAQDICDFDHKPCYVATDPDEAHWRCGTVQCGKSQPAATDPPWLDKCTDASFDDIIGRITWEQAA